MYYKMTKNATASDTSSKEKAPKPPKEKAPKAPKEKAPKASKESKPPKEKAPKVSKEVESKPDVSDDVKVDDKDATLKSAQSGDDKMLDNIAMLNKQAAQFASDFKDFMAHGSRIKNQHKELIKAHESTIKVLHKMVRKRSNKNGARKPAGFVKPAKISNELADFLNLPHDTKLARTAATVLINEYAAKNNLKHGRAIEVDDKLDKLLQVPKDLDGGLTYFNLQRYMARHFETKAEADAAAAAASSVSV
jgi:hypothetical protein